MFLSELSGWWFDINMMPLYCETGVTNFEDKGMTWYSNFQGWRSWELRFMSIAEGWSIHWMTSLEHIGDTVMSWKHWPKTEVKVWWTIGMNEPSRRLPNPNNHGDRVKCHSHSSEQISTKDEPCRPPSGWHHGSQPRVRTYPTLCRHRCAEAHQLH